jgi:hypothetical protein
MSYFKKPLESILREKEGNKVFYYLALMKKAPEVSGSVGHSVNRDCFYDKKKIDTMPRYLRRGGEYNHDPVIMYSRDDDVPKKENKTAHIVKLCKIYGLEITYRTPKSKK